MKLLVREELRPLVMDHSSPCVSLYMPTLRGQEGQQNAIRFKNLCGKAREDLIANGMRGPDAAEHLKPLDQMLQDSDLWRHCSEGLAVFRSRRQFRSYRLPRAFQEALVVGDRFHLRPLLPLFTGEDFFYLLVVNLKGIRLLQCTRDLLSEIDIADRVPAGLEATMAAYVLEESVQFHSVGATGAGGRVMGAMHGHGVSGSDKAVRKKYILEYFHQADRGLVQVLGDHTPMLLAGVKYLCALYRQANSYRGLLEVEVGGSMELTSLKDLHRQGWEAYEGHRLQLQQRALARFREVVGTSATSTELGKIVPAAFNGQVRTLLAPVGLEQWGRFDPASGKIEVHPKQVSGEEDLVDFAAIHTLMHGGEVYAVGQGPSGGAPLAAIFRYA